MKSTSSILTVVGARPQFIKSVAVTRELARRVDQWLVHAGQHPDDHMGSAFLAELGVEHLMRGSIPRGIPVEGMADMLAGLSEEMARVAPAAVLVYGDTDATWRAPSTPTTTACRSSTSRPVCAVAIGRCQKSTTGS